MSSGRQRPGEISVGFSRRKVRGQSPKLWDKACKRRKGWPKYHALHVSPEWCKVFPKFVAAEQSWEILLLYKHRHFIRGHQNKFCLCFALHNLKRHLPNKHSLLVSLSPNMLLHLEADSAAAAILLQYGKRPFFPSPSSPLFYLRNSAACRKTWEEKNGIKCWLLWPRNKNWKKKKWNLMPCPQWLRDLEPNQGHENRILLFVY